MIEIRRATPLGIRRPFAAAQVGVSFLLVLDGLADLPVKLGQLADPVGRLVQSIVAFADTDLQGEGINSLMRPRCLRELRQNVLAMAEGRFPPQLTHLPLRLAEGVDRIGSGQIALEERQRHLVGAGVHAAPLRCQHQSGAQQRVPPFFAV
jgi:hypothetical protein